MAQAFQTSCSLSRLPVPHYCTTLSTISKRNESGLCKRNKFRRRRGRHGAGERTGWVFYLLAWGGWGASRRFVLFISLDSLGSALPINLPALFSFLQLLLSIGISKYCRQRFWLEYLPLLSASACVWKSTCMGVVWGRYVGAEVYLPSRGVDRERKKSNICWKTSVIIFCVCARRRRLVSRG